MSYTGTHTRTHAGTVPADTPPSGGDTCGRDGFDRDVPSPEREARPAAHEASATVAKTRPPEVEAPKIEPPKIEPPKIEPPRGVHALPVTEVEHYTDRLFRLRAARPAGFRFRAGEFVMIALPPVAGERLVWRAYSIASPAWAEHVEFLSIVVPDGPLTSRLVRAEVGDTLWMREKSTGTLVADALEPGGRLWMLGTGTGLAPFASVARDPETYERFERAVIVHTARMRAELRYGRDMMAAIAAGASEEDAMLAEMIGGRLAFVPTVTRETPGEGEMAGRLTDLLRAGAVHERLGLARADPPFDPAIDRVMICGSSAMNTEVRALCEATGLVEGSNARPGTFVVEKAFVG